MNKLNYILIFVLAIVIGQSCQQPGGESTGSEYMPDMGHSVAYEANYYNYYYHNTWGDKDAYYEFAQPRVPVNGTVPRRIGNNGFNIPTQGSKPYYYENTEAGRMKAMAELIDNPLPITEKGLAEGKELYDVFCATCHGDKGDGAGYLVRDDGGVYPVAPANFLLDEHVNATNGRYYHAIVHGRNMMGAYADKISYEERWNVIHYIRSLQAKEKKLVYNQLENTLNSVDRPAGENYLADNMVDDTHEDEMHEDHNEDMHHDHDHSHDDSKDHNDDDHSDHDHEDHGH